MLVSKLPFRPLGHFLPSYPLHKNRKYKWPKRPDKDLKMKDRDGEAFVEDFTSCLYKVRTGPYLQPH